jgi:hypothetical protein
MPHRLPTIRLFRTPEIDLAPRMNTCRISFRLVQFALMHSFCWAVVACLPPNPATVDWRATRRCIGCDRALRIAVAHMQVHDVELFQKMGLKDPVAVAARANSLSGNASAKAIPDRVCVFGGTWKVMLVFPKGECFGVNVGPEGWTSDDPLGLICDRWRATLECSPVSWTTRDME